MFTANTDLIDEAMSPIEAAINSDIISRDSDYDEMTNSRIHIARLDMGRQVSYDINSPQVMSPKG